MINFVEKKELIIVTILTFLIALTGILATYAIDTKLSYNDTTDYNMSLSFDLSSSTNKQVTIQAGKTKFFDIDVKNSNSGTIKYGIAYSMVTPSSLPSGVTIAKSWKSANPTSGLINANATLPVTIAVENTSSTDITIALSIINGYEKGGDLVVPTGKTLITGVYRVGPYDPLDNSGANFPQLTDALIPVVSNELASTWVKADVNGDKVTATCDKLGDLNDDGEVDSNDIIDVAFFINNKGSFTNSKKVCADVDGDGLITKNDYDLLYKYYNGKVTTFPKGEPLSTVTGTVYDTPYVWYNYNNKQWANAVLVSESNRQKYLSDEPGTEIAEEDILAFYVWIPRFKYKVWNINKVIGTQSYNAQTTGIDIVFEAGTSSTGTISCTYSYAAPSSTAGSPNETCTGSNGDYYTHPAFTFGNQELKGFWMGKFELSSETPNTDDGGGNTTTLTPRILPNVTSWRYNPVSNFWKVIYDMQTSNNIYGLPTSRTNADSHMLTNMEWGAVAYLTNSKYGRCTNGSCTEVSINGYGETSNYTTMTGCGPISSDSTSSGTTCNAYNTTLGQTASTTGNIYGVYDMSGGATEYVMGNMSSSSGTTYTYNASSAGSNFTYSTDTAKYLIPYAYGTTYKDQTAYNRGRLGDATSEVVTKASYGWYNDAAEFPNASYSWFHRGGYFLSGSTAGPFYFGLNSGTSAHSCSGRVALLVLL